MSKQNNIKKNIKIVLTLCLITAIMGALLAFVNHLTKDRIAEQSHSAMDKAIAGIFGDCKSEVVEGDYAEPVSEVYAVTVDGESAGYCVFVTPKGYGGEVEMMVGIELDGSVKGVTIVSHSETPNLGTKVVENEIYLAQYNGKRDPVILGREVKAVSGATRSSNAVRDGVNAALALGLGKEARAASDET